MSKPDSTPDPDTEAVIAAMEEARAVLMAVPYSNDVPTFAEARHAVDSIEAAISTLRQRGWTGPDAWRPIETAKKNGKPILVCLKNPIPNDRDDLRSFDGIRFVARHPGLADDGFDIGWNFAAPVGHGGFPDEWIAGWQPLSEPPPTRTGGEE